MARALVERAHAVTLPLARHEQRRLDVEAEEVVLERRAVALAHEEAHEARVALAHVLEGEAEISITGKSHHLQGGEMILMPAGQPHALKAVKRFKMMLTMIRS